MSVRFNFCWLGDKETEDQTDKIDFQNSQTEPTFMVIENQADMNHMISFDWFGSVHWFSVVLTPLV